MTARRPPWAPDRLIPVDELEHLLAWWRTTAHDRQGEPLFCRHGEHAYRPCSSCARNRRAVLRRRHKR